MLAGNSIMLSLEKLSKECSTNVILITYSTCHCLLPNTGEKNQYCLRGSPISIKSSKNSLISTFKKCPPKSSNRISMCPGNCNYGDKGRTTHLALDTGLLNIEYTVTNSILGCWQGTSAHRLPQAPVAAGRMQQPTPWGWHWAAGLSQVHKGQDQGPLPGANSLGLPADVTGPLRDVPGRLGACAMQQIPILPSMECLHPQHLLQAPSPPCTSHWNPVPVISDRMQRAAPGACARWWSPVLLSMQLAQLGGDWETSRAWALWAGKTPAQGDETGGGGTEGVPTPLHVSDMMMAWLHKRISIPDSRADQVSERSQASQGSHRPPHPETWASFHMNRCLIWDHPWTGDCFLPWGNRKGLGACTGQPSKDSSSGWQARSVLLHSKETQFTSKGDIGE